MLNSPNKSRVGSGLATHTDLGFSKAEALRSGSVGSASIEESAAGNQLAAQKRDDQQLMNRIMTEHFEDQKQREQLQVIEKRK